MPSLFSGSIFEISFAIGNIEKGTLSDRSIAHEVCSGILGDAEFYLSIEDIDVGESINYCKNARESLLKLAGTRTDGVCDRGLYTSLLDMSRAFGRIWSPHRSKANQEAIARAIKGEGNKADIEKMVKFINRINALRCRLADNIYVIVQREDLNLSEEMIERLREPQRL